MDTNKIIMTESTKKIVESEITVNLEDVTEQELVEAINATKKLVATITESGEIKIKQVLLG
jgi:hypothetical protein